jgi:hypothetical protein
VGRGLGARRGRAAAGPFSRREVLGPARRTPPCLVFPGRIAHSPPLLPAAPPPGSPHVAAVTAKCYAAGACTSGRQAIEAVAAAADARNRADEAYGFKGDPYFGRSKLGSDKFYGPMVHAGWRAAAA